MAMEVPHLTPQELSVFRVIAELGEADIASIQKYLASEQKLEYNTILTFSRKLAEKGVVKRDRVGRKDIYSPTIDPKKVLKKLIENFIGTTIKKNPSMLVDLLFEAKPKLQEKDYQKLKLLLD
jgi:predicted transcriptional regulator